MDKCTFLFGVPKQQIVNNLSCSCCDKDSFPTVIMQRFWRGLNEVTLIAQKKKRQIHKQMSMFCVFEDSVTKDLLTPNTTNNFHGLTCGIMTASPDSLLREKQVEKPRTLWKTEDLWSFSVAAHTLSHSSVK